MTTQIRPKLLLLLLIIGIAFLPIGESFAVDAGSMSNMTNLCVNCDLDNDNDDVACDIDNNCVAANSCTGSFTAYESTFITSIEHWLNASTAPAPDNHRENQFESPSIGPLYRPPIT